MLSPESIFRQPPQALRLSLRKLLGALGYAFDAVELHHARLIAAASDFYQPESPPKFTELAPEQRIGMISDAWSCLDWMHRFRQLVRRMPFGEPRPLFVDPFLEELDKIRLLRNRLHHFDEDFEAGEHCESGHPILGSLSWIDSRYASGFLYAFIASGPSVEGGALANLPILAREDLPSEIGNFSLLAFDRTLSLSAMLSTIREFMHEFEPLVQTAIANTLREAATERNVPLEVAGRYAPCDMITAMALDSDGDQWTWNTASSYSRVEVAPGCMDLQERGSDT
ncbi:hypothetical protein D3C84_418870 [compost metagenome]